MKRKARNKKHLQDHLKQVNLYAAGIDIGSTSHFVAVPPSLDDRPIREYSCFTVDLEHMADWLKKIGISTIAMESTGVYWIPAFELLEERGFEVFLVNPRHLKNVPSRKTDVIKHNFFCIKQNKSNTHYTNQNKNNILEWNSW